MRYFIHLGFDGTDYRGWQRQKHPRNTVQEVIEHTLKRMFKQALSAYGCGRTDAGVHASQYFVQINIVEAPDFDIKFRLNKNLPDDIAVFDVIQVNQDNHVRYDAIARTYDYFIHWKKDPVLMRYSSFYDDLSLDFDLMKKAVILIRNTKDFKHVCKQPDLYPNTLCNITNCELFVDEDNGRMRFTITSNRFLRGMVRICIFYLLKVGNGEISLTELEEILSLRKDHREKIPAFPNGLFLSKIDYPYLKLDNDHRFAAFLKTGLI